MIFSKESAIKSTPPTEEWPLSVCTVKKKTLMRVNLSKAVGPDNNPGLQITMVIHIRKKFTILNDNLTTCRSMTSPVGNLIVTVMMMVITLLIRPFSLLKD